SHHGLDRHYVGRRLPSSFYLLYAHFCLGLRLNGFHTTRPNIFTQAPLPLQHFEHYRTGMPNYFACHPLQTPAYGAYLVPTPGLGKSQ
ncbi:MAG: hypothetical protein OEY91_09530, partial [Nitrospirota bacterium]|nr:hypothetical protein [Nitrospirota bacterium]